MEANGFPHVSAILPLGRGRDTLGPVEWRLGGSQTWAGLLEKIKSVASLGI